MLRGASDPDPEWHERTTGKIALLERIMPYRNPGGAGGASASQEVRPSEHWSRAKAIRELYIVRGEVRALAETIDRPIRSLARNILKNRYLARLRATGDGVVATPRSAEWVNPANEVI